MIKVNKASLTGTQRHNQRQLSDENIANSASQINKEFSYLNYDLVNDGNITYSKKMNDFIEENVEGTVRKDAVLVNEWLVTSDHDFFARLNDEDTKLYFEKSLEFFQQRFGEDNILYANVHMDESTPHMHLGVIPYDAEKKKLTSKTIFDRSALLSVQNDLPDHLKAAGFEVDRGKPNSKAEHLSVLEMRERTVRNREFDIEVKEDYVDELIEDRMNELNESARVTAEAYIRQTELDLEEEELEKQKADLEKKEKALQAEKAKLEVIKSDLEQMLDEIEFKEQNLITTAEMESKALEDKFDALESGLKSNLQDKIKDEVTSAYNMGFKDGLEKQKDQEKIDAVINTASNNTDISQSTTAIKKSVVGRKRLPAEEIERRKQERQEKRALIEMNRKLKIESQTYDPTAHKNDNAETNAPKKPVGRVRKSTVPTEYEKHLEEQKRLEANIKSVLPKNNNVSKKPSSSSKHNTKNNGPVLGD